MKRRGIFLIMLGMLTAVLTAAVMGPRFDRVVCPATGYAFTGPVELVFAHEPASVAACLGEGCTPAPVAKSADGRWLVPQSAPYLAPTANAISVHLDAVDASDARVTRTLPVESESTGEYPDGPACGGPFRFKPVQVP
jgi:hypothetical protein